jgi:hypothetical protein
MAYMTGLIGCTQQAESTPDPAIWAESLDSLTTSEVDQEYNLGGLTSYAGGIALKPDGSVMAVGSMSGTLNDFIIEYNLGTAFTINSNVTVSSSSGDNLDVNPPMGLIGGLSVADDGSKVYSFGRSTNEVNRFDLSTAWDFGTGGSAQSNYNTSSQITNVYDGFVKNDGTEVYVIGYGPDNVYQYTLSTAHDLSTASLTNTFDISAKSTVSGGIHFHSEGYAFVVADSFGDKLHKYNLSTAWDVSTASFHSSSDSLNSKAATLSGVWFDDDWTYVFFTDQDGDDVYRINTAGVAPGQVSNLSVSAASTSQLNLSWTAIGNADSYKVERATSSGGSFSQIANPSSNSYSDTSLSQGTQYFYKVRATNSQGDGSYSSEANNYTLPGQVTGLSASAASNTQINLSWNNPSGIETGYQVHRATSSGGTYSSVGTPSGTSYSDTSLSQNTTYYYKVLAVNAGGNGAFSSIVNETTQNNSSAPTGVSIATTSSGNYNNAAIIQNSEGGHPWINEDGSSFSSATLDLTIPSGFSSADAIEYAINDSSPGQGYTEVKVYAYLRASGATSYAWNLTNITLNGNGIGSLSNLVKSTSQDCTSSPALTFRLNGVSGGRGYLPIVLNDEIDFEINASATNSTGTTNATDLDINLTGSG